MTPAERRAALKRFRERDGGSWSAALIATLVLVLVAPGAVEALRNVEHGGFGYRAYCGTAKRPGAAPDPGLCPADLTLPLPPAPRDDGTGDASNACVYTCNRPEKTDGDPKAEKRGPHDLLAAMRACSNGEVSTARCSADIALKGQKFDARLRLTSVRVAKLEIEGSSLAGLVCLDCAFSSGGSVRIVDSTVEADVVLRGRGDAPEQPDPGVEPKSYEQTPSMEGSAAGSDRGASPIHAKVTIERAKIGGRLDLQWLDFVEPVAIRSTSVAAGLYVDRAVFRKAADFQAVRAQFITAVGARFAGPARWFGAGAERVATFGCATFDEDTNFTGFTASMGLTFAGARFRGTRDGGADASRVTNTLDGIRAQSLGLPHARFARSASLTGLQTEVLDLEGTCGNEPLRFKGGKIDRLAIRPDQSWLKSQPADLTGSASYPGITTDGLGTVTVGMIDPDEIGPVRMSHVLQFLRNSDDSLALFEATDRQYRGNGKLLWAHHVAFCGAAQKTNPFLGFMGRVRNFSPEVPALVAAALFVLHLVLVLATGIRPAGNDLVAAARSLHEEPLTPDRQRLFQDILAKAPPPDDGLATGVSGADLVARLEARFDAAPTRNAWKILRYCAASILSVVKLGPTREYAPSKPWGRFATLVFSALWTIVLAWAAAVATAYWT